MSKAKFKIYRHNGTTDILRWMEVIPNNESLSVAQIFDVFQRLFPEQLSELTLDDCFVYQTPVRKDLVFTFYN